MTRSTINRMRDHAGDLVQLRAEGPSAETARADLQANAAALTTHTKAFITGASTIADAAAAWLPTDILDRVLGREVTMDFLAAYTYGVCVST